MISIHRLSVYLLLLASIFSGVLAEETAAQEESAPSPFAATKNCLLLVHLGSKDQPASRQLMPLIHSLERDTVLASRILESIELGEATRVSYDATLDELREVISELSELTLDCSLDDTLPLTASEMGMGIRLTLATPHPEKIKARLESLLARHVDDETPEDFKKHLARLKWSVEPGKLSISHNPFALKGGLGDQPRFGKVWEALKAPKDPSAFFYMNLERMPTELLPMLDGVGATSSPLLGSGLDEIRSLVICIQGGPQNSHTLIHLGTDGPMKGQLSSWLSGHAPAGRLSELLIPGSVDGIFLNLPWSHVKDAILMAAPAEGARELGFSIGEILDTFDGTLALQLASTPWLTLGLSNPVSADQALKKLLSNPRVAATTREVSGRKVHALRLRQIPHPFYLTLIEDGTLWHLGTDPLAGLDLAQALDSRPPWPFDSQHPILAGRFCMDLKWLESLAPMIEAGRTALDQRRKDVGIERRLKLTLPLDPGTGQGDFSARLEEQGFCIRMHQWTKGGRILDGSEGDVMMTAIFHVIADLAPSFFKGSPRLRQLLSDD